MSVATCSSVVRSIVSVDPELADDGALEDDRRARSARSVAELPRMGRAAARRPRANAIPAQMTPGSAARRATIARRMSSASLACSDDAFERPRRRLAHASRSLPSKRANRRPQLVGTGVGRRSSESTSTSVWCAVTMSVVVRKSIGGALVGHARAADPADPYERLDEIVEAGWCVVLDRGCAHHELAARCREAAEVPVVLRPRVVEVREVATVVDDALRIRVGEPHARQRRVLERWAPVSDVDRARVRRVTSG